MDALRHAVTCPVHIVIIYLTKKHKLCSRSDIQFLYRPSHCVIELKENNEFICTVKNNNI